MINQETVENLINDVAYLAHEAEALTYVIDSVPFDQKPAEGEYSILDTLLFLDYSQQNYYRLIIEDVLKSNRPINLNGYTNPKDSFELEEEPSNVQKVLYKISKHRAALLNIIEKRPLIDWEKQIEQGRESLSLFEFTMIMVREERSILKTIAELILAHQNERQFQREVNARQKQE